MTDTTASAASTEGTEGTPPEGTEESGKTFSQADLDRIVTERLARESKRYSDYDDLKAKAEAADAAEREREEANASDLDKAVKAARKEVEDALRAEFAQERVADKIDALAAGKFADPEDARLRLGSRVDEFVKDGAVDTDAISKALDDVLEKHPHLAAKAEKPAPPAPERAGIGVSGTGKAPAQVSPGYDRLKSAYADKG
jgi:hypothetical protein